MVARLSELAISFTRHEHPPVATVDEATAHWAFDRLGPERFGDTTVTPVSVPQFWAADLPRSFIVCEQDRSMPLERDCEVGHAAVSRGDDD